MDYVSNTLVLIEFLHLQTLLKMSKDHVKKTIKISANETKETDRTTSEAPKVAGSLAAKIKQVSIKDLRVGDKVLYPGNRVIPVATIDHYVKLRSGTDHIGDELLYVVTFEGQPKEAPIMAFPDTANIYIYAP